MADGNDVCNENLKTDYDIVGSGLCSALCLFGIMYTFFGYRCFKAVMFLSGVIFGSTAVYLICREERIFQHETSVELAAGISVGIGILCGFITMLVKYVGLFLQGFFLGVLNAIAVITALQSYYNPSTLWITFCILFFTGVFFSFLTLKFEKCFVIIGTAVLGSGLIVTCIDYFLENFKLLLFIWEELMGSSTHQVCWYSWLVFGLWPFLSVVGIIIQCKVTGKGYDHTDVIIVSGRRKRVRTHLVRPQNNNQQQQNQPPAITRSGRTTTTNGGGDRSMRVQETTAAVAGSRNCRNPSSNQQRQRSSIVVVASSSDDLLPPPSYQECIRSGICEPLTSNEPETSRLLVVSNNSNRSEQQQQPSSSSRIRTTTVQHAAQVLAASERRNNNVSGGNNRRKRGDAIAAHAQRLLQANDHRRSGGGKNAPRGMENPSCSIP